MKKLTFFKTLAMLCCVLAFQISCIQHECGNQDIEGKYENRNYLKDTNYIVLNKDGKYSYYFKPFGKKAKSFSGSWTFSKDDCLVRFDIWKDIVGYMKMDEVSANYAHVNGNRLIFLKI